jgi:hypothetical protein
MREWDEYREDSRHLESVSISGVVVKPGDRVRLCPQRSADILDLILKDKVAIIEAIECDFDNKVHLAVVMEDDPGRDLGMLRQPGHRFFFSTDDVKPIDGRDLA